MAETATTNPAVQQYTVVSVQPGPDYGWEVLLEGAEKSHLFADRSLALSYAKMWASANRPSKVRVFGAREGVKHEWIFR